MEFRWSGYALFETAIGTCGLAWREAGLIRVLLPDRSPARAAERLAELAPDLREVTALPAPVAAAVSDIQRLLGGERVDLTHVAVDLARVPEFDRRVYAITRAIGPGRTRTYGEVARELGDLGLSRAVGQSLGRNPWPIVVPCHRVVAVGGQIGGFSAPGGAATKRRILAIEAAQGTLPL